jgi:hypothetical protein
MPISPTKVYNNSYLIPLYDANFKARLRPINLAPGLTYKRGQILALIDSRNEVQTITGSTSITGGTYKIKIGGYATSDLAYNVDAATVQAVLQGLMSVGSGNIGVSGGALNTSTPFTVTFQGELANTPFPMLEVVTTSLTGSQTVTVAQTFAGLSKATYAPFSATTIAAPSVGFTATAAAGTAFPAGVYQVAYTYVTASGGESLPSGTQSVTTASGNLAIAITAVTPLPTGVASVNWYVSTAPGSSDLAFAINNNGAAFTLNTAPAVGAKKLPNTNTAYSDTNGVGSSKARGILPYSVVTDADSNYKFSDGDLDSSIVEMYVSGVFDTKELVGLTQKAIDDVQGFLESGTVANGVLRFG